jgi:hypothetical protein
VLLNLEVSIYHIRHSTPQLTQRLYFSSLHTAPHLSQLSSFRSKIYTSYPFLCCFHEYVYFVVGSFVNKMQPLVVPVLSRAESYNPLSGTTQVYKYQGLLNRWPVDCIIFRPIYFRPWSNTYNRWSCIKNQQPLYCLN